MAKNISTARSYSQNKLFVINKKKVLVIGAILLTLFLWWYGDYRLIGLDDSIKPRMLGIPYNFINLSIPICCAFFLDRKYRSHLFSERNVGIIILFIAFLAIGKISGNPSKFIQNDMYMLLWFFSGYAFMYLIWLSGKPKVFLSLTMIALASIVFLTSSSGAQDVETARRVTSSLSYKYIELLGFILGINLVWSSATNYVFAGLTGTSLLVYFNYAVLLSATRSATIVLALLVIFASLSLSRPKQKGKVQKLIKLLYAFGLLVLVCGIYLAVTGAYFSDRSVISERLDDSGNVYSRIDEAQLLFEQMSVGDILLGKGIGAGFRTYHGGERHFPHIAIFGVLLLFGILPFLYVVGLLYIKLPVQYLKALSTAKKRGNTNALIIVTPGTLSWATLLWMSGGISYYAFFGIGITLCFYEEFTRFTQKP